MKRFIILLIIVFLLVLFLCQTAGCEQAPSFEYQPSKLYPTDGPQPFYAQLVGPYEGDADKPLYRIYQHSRHIRVIKRTMTMRSVKCEGGVWYFWNNCDWVICVNRTANLGWWHHLECIDEEGNVLHQVFP